MGALMKRAVMGAVLALVAWGSAPAGAAGQADSAAAVANRFMERLRVNDFAGAAALVQPATRDRLGETQLSTVWAQVRGALGDLTGTRPRAVTPVDTLQAVEMFGDFGAQTLLLRVVVNPSREVVGFWLGPVPPEAQEAGAVPVPPYADRSTFREEEVSIGAEPWVLPATLSIPAGGAGRPAVILVHGSGPHDRDETVGGARVFRDLAWGLASRGIAVLRYEKRTKVHGARMGGDVTVDDEVIDDAVAALAYLRAHPAVDPARVYVIGHSLGAQLAPEIAQRDGRTAGAVLMAAPARPIEVLMHEQLTYLRSLPMNAAPESQARIDEALAQVDRLLAGTAPDTALVLGAPASYFRDLKRRDAVAVARTIETPLLVLQGERDYQVTMEDFGLWQQAASSRAAVTLRSFPGLNHLFVAGTGAPTPAEYATPGFVAVEVVEAIAAWIRGGGAGASGRGTSSPE
jgi:dienelactone hydrolase